MTNKFTLPLTFVSSSTLTAIISLLCGILIIALMPVLTRFSESEISPTATMFHRVWIAALLLSLWEGIIKRILKRTKEKSADLDSHCIDRDRSQVIYTRKFLGFLFGASLLFAIQQVVWAWSITETSIANSALLHNFTPFFTTLGAWIIFAQRFDRRFTLGTIVAIAGASIIGFNDFSYSIDKIHGDILAFLSAFFYAGYLLLAEQVRLQLNTTIALLLFCGLGSLFFLPILPWIDGNIFPTSHRGWFFAIGLSLTIVLGHGLMIYSLEHLSSGLVSVTMLLNPVLNGILGWIVFGENLDSYNLTGFPIILLGVYLAISSQSMFKKQNS